MNLKPCPFCGGEAALGTMTIRRWKDTDGNDGTFTGHAVNCIMCGSTNRGIAEGFKTPEQATEHWNRRNEAVGEALETVFCNMDENGDPVGGQPETQWEVGYAAGLRHVYRVLKQRGFKLPVASSTAPNRPCPRCGANEGEKCKDYNESAQQCNARRNDKEERK